MRPFQEDALVCDVAAKIGMSVNRVESIRVTDEEALKRQKFMRLTPDYPKIRKALKAGIPVYGVELGDTEYIFRRIKKGGSNARKDSNDSEEKLLAEDTPL